MTVVPNNQGAVKSSEVVADSAHPLLQTAVSEDGLTVVQRQNAVMQDVLQRLSLLLTSRNSVGSNAGSIAWSGTTITLTTSTDIVVKVPQGPAGLPTDLVLTYGPTNTATTFNSIALAEDEYLYVEVRRDLLVGGTVVLQNAVGGGSLTPGQTVRRALSIPASTWGADNAASGTLMIPIAYRKFGGIYWPLHGIFWPANTASPLGAVITTTNQPLGSIQPYHRLGQGAGPYGYSTTKLVAPGYQLCDGSIVIDPQSPFRNPTRNDDGTPGVGFNPALDVFTPRLTGAPATWSNLQTWNEGDYVTDGIDEYVAVQAVPLSIAIGNTTYWQPQSVFNDTNPANPFNRYRKTTQNQNNNTYLRGNNTTVAADQSAGYGGANSKTISANNLPTHTHGVGTLATGGAGGHSHTVNVRNAAGGSLDSVDVGIGNGAASPLYSVGSTNTISNHTHSLSGNTGNNTTTNTPLNVEPAYGNVLYLIKIY